MGLFVSFKSIVLAVPVDEELMQQGSVRTCLKASFASDTAGTGPIRKTKIHLTGRCESPSGCTCISSWGRNSNVERLENESCDQQFDKALNNMSAAAIAKKKAAGKCNAGKKSKRTGKDCGDCSCFAEDQAASCGHAKADTRDPFLSSLQAGSRVCNIVQNNIAAKQGTTNLASANGSQVLGAATGVLPYGDVDVIVEEETYRHTPHDFLASGTLDGQATGTGGETKDIEQGNNKTQKEGTLIFSQADSDVKVKNLETNCTSISWDPYGRVFDATSLEPISDVEVTMIDNATKLPAVQQYNRVDDITGEDGVFNIQVEKEGIYELTADPLSDHSFTLNVQLDPNWKHIYSDLYFPSVTYVEKKGVPTHHDIPLQPNDKPYTFAAAEPVIGSMKSQNMGDTVVYMGRVTFPFAKVCLVQADDNSVIGDCVNANNIGRFTIAVDVKDIPPVQTTIKVNKVDLTKLKFNDNDEIVETLNERSYISTNIERNPKNFFNPILSSVDGYVYDTQGKLIPNATVLVKLKMNDSQFYQTVADANGYFAIATNKLPYVEYYFEFVDPVSKQKVIKNTSQFVEDNKEYLKLKKINPMQGTKSVAKSGIARPVVNNNPNTDTKKMNQPVSRSDYAIFFIIGAIIILLIIGVFAFMKMKKANTSSY